MNRAPLTNEDVSGVLGYQQYCYNLLLINDDRNNDIGKVVVPEDEFK